MVGLAFQRGLISLSRIVVAVDDDSDARFLRGLYVAPQLSCVAAFSSFLRCACWFQLLSHLHDVVHSVCGSQADVAIYLRTETGVGGRSRLSRRGDVPRRREAWASVRVAEGAEGLRMAGDGARDR